MDSPFHAEDLYALVNRYRGWVIAKVRRMEDAEDVLHNTFLAAYEAMQQHHLRCPEGYVATVIRRIVNREINRHIDQRRHVQMDTVERHKIIDENTPEAQYRREERAARVRHMVDLMPHPVRREIIRRAYFEEQPAAQIMREMQITPGRLARDKSRAVGFLAGRRQFQMGLF